MCSDVYTLGFGIVVAKGDIDFGIRWRAGMVQREGAGYRINGERDHGFSQRSGTTVMARNLSGLAVVKGLCADDIWDRFKHAPSI